MAMMSYKIIIVGDSSVGKSSILNYYVNKTFYDSYDSTIGIDFKSKIINFDGKIVKLQLWDTAGQERFRSIIRSYYRSCNGAIIVFDLTSNKTLESINMWLDELKNYNKNDYPIPIILVGNKSDLCLDGISVVDKKNVNKILDTNPNVTYIETSAKKGLMIDEIFLTLVKKLTVDQITDSIKNINSKIISFDEIPNKSYQTICYRC
jgi:small GTP-binding protein